MITIINLCLNMILGKRVLLTKWELLILRYVRECT